MPDLQLLMAKVKKMKILCAWHFWTPMFSANPKSTEQPWWKWETITN